MKKLFGVLFAGLLLLAVAGPASADHRIWAGQEPNYEIAVGGQVEIDGWWKSYSSAGLDNESRWYNQETRLWFKGQFADVEAMIRLEQDYDWDYANQNKGYITLIKDDEGDVTDVKHNMQVALDLAYIKFPLPGTPVKMSAGLQPLLFGKSILVDDDVYMLTATVPMDKMGLTLGTIKWTETYDSLEDRDSYFLLFNTSAVANNTISALFYTERAGTVDDYKPWDLGISVDGSAAAFKYWFEGHYQGGSLDDDLDLKAYALAAGGSTTVGAATVSLAAVYGSGDDDDDDDEYSAFRPVSPYFIPDIIVVFDFNGKSISNVWALLLKGQMNPMPNLTAWAQAGYYNRVEDDASGESFIGTEFDLGAKYTINKYMTWKLTFGYLATGDVFDAADVDALYNVNNEFMVTF